MELGARFSNTHLNIYFCLDLLVNEKAKSNKYPFQNVTSTSEASSFSEKIELLLQYKFNMKRKLNLETDARV